MTDVTIFILIYILSGFLGAYLLFLKIKKFYGYKSIKFISINDLKFDTIKDILFVTGLGFLTLSIGILLHLFPSIMINFDKNDYNDKVNKLFEHLNDHKNV